MVTTFRVVSLATIMLGVVVGMPAGKAQSFTLRSANFIEGGTLHSKYNGSDKANPDCVGQNISPQLSWSGAPPGTRSYALIMTHLEGGQGLGEVNWIVYGIPPSISSAAEGEGSKFPGNYVAGTGTSGRNTYMGPCPSGQNHHAVFSLIATDLEPTALQPGLTQNELLSKLAGNTKGAANLVGIFRRPPDPDNNIAGLSVSRDGTKVLGVTGDGAMTLWHVPTSTPLLRLKVDSGSGIAISPDGRYIAAGPVTTENGDAYVVWQAETGTLVFTKVAGGFLNEVITFTHDGNYLATGSDNGVVTVIDIANPRITKTYGKFSFDSRKKITSISFSQDNELILLGMHGQEKEQGVRTLELWERASRREIPTFPYSYPVTAAAISPNRQFAIVGSWRGTFWYDLRNRNPVRAPGATTRVADEAVFFSSDSAQAKGCCASAHLKVWNSATGEEVRSVRVSGDVVSADGTTIAGKDFEKIRILDANTGQLVKSLGP